MMSKIRFSVKKKKNKLKPENMIWLTQPWPSGFLKNLVLLHKKLAFQLINYLYGKGFHEEPTKS